MLVTNLSLEVASVIRKHQSIKQYKFIEELGELGMDNNYIIYNTETHEYYRMFDSSIVSAFIDMRETVEVEIIKRKEKTVIYYE